MTQATKEELLNKIKELDIDEAKKNELLAKIEGANELDNDLIDWLQDEIQSLIDDNFAKAGITDDENAPEYQAKHKEMVEEIDAAEKEFDEGMKKLGEEADKVTEEAAKKIEDTQIQAAKDKLAEA